MKLYHKQLKGVAHLRKEKKRLKIDRKVAINNAQAKEDAKDPESGLASFISMANDLLFSPEGKGVITTMAMPLVNIAFGKAKNSFLKKAAKEVIGGYVKWKAIDFSVTLAMRFMRMQSHKADKNC